MSTSEYERREAVRRKILADAEQRMARVLGKTVNKSEDSSVTKQPTVSGSSANDDFFGGSGGYPFPSPPRFQVNLDDKETAANFGFEPQRDVILFFIGILIRYFVIVFRSAQVIILWLVFDFVWQQLYRIRRQRYPEHSFIVDCCLSFGMSLEKTIFVGHFLELLHYIGRDTTLMLAGFITAHVMLLTTVD
ncbi:hypothetical protein T11_13471 [Trichinella zimbabwensis]|uniref:Uncharacterized protein n=1 Tax=Trichinella zimbabwensis TaxID=268475 RepID=A0A0V1H2H2_9BILA|nr:hypothetical protein T11_13471 [Trichinella zimbabwensis]